MLEESFVEVYTKFKMHFYKEVFKKFGDATMNLTTVETFCMEIIYAMDKPTVSEFAEYISISSANAADKVNNLIKKGYLEKIQSSEDKRKFYLMPTQKYIDNYNISTQYRNTVMKRVKERFTPDEIETVERILKIMSEELMPEFGVLDNSEN